MEKPVLFLFLAASSYTDLKYRTIDNFQNLFFFITGLIFMTLERGLYGLADGLITAVIVFAAFFVFYGAGLMGAGDIKFIMRYTIISCNHFGAVKLFDVLLTIMHHKR